MYVEKYAIKKNKKIKIRKGRGYSVCKRVAVAVKKVGCPRIILYDRGAVGVVIVEMQLYAIKFVFETFQNYDVLKYDIYDTEN